MLHAAQRCRVVAGVLVLLHLGLGATPQALDLLITLGQDGAALAWAGLAAGTAWLALNAWFWSRFAMRQHPGGGRMGGAIPLVRASASVGVVADAFRTASASVPAAMGAPGGGGRLAVASNLLGDLCLLLLLASLRTGLATRAAPLPAFQRLGQGTRRMVALSVAVGTSGLVAFSADPVWAAAVVQPASIVLLAAAGLMSGGTLLLDLGRRTRVPVLLLVFLGAALLAALRNRGILPDNHALRQLPPALPAQPGVEAAFLAFPDASVLVDGGPTPVVLVAASGSGIAAAYWTATVLGDLADASPGFANRVFAMTGVSGGALALLAYKAADQPSCRNPNTQPSPQPAQGFRACLQLALGGEFLRPALGVMLYPDLLQRFVPFPMFRNRAEALERAWQARWTAVFGNGRLAGPFLDLWPAQPWPALLLNGTLLNRGGQLVASNFLLGPDHIGGDGGGQRLLRKLGASTLLELLDVLDGTARRHGRPVRFVVLQVVNAPCAGSGMPPKDPETPWSLLPRGLTGPATVPLRTRGVSASEALARRVVGLGGAYVPVRLGRSPTGRTAPLGWSLSAIAREVINEQWTPACRDRVLAGAGRRQPQTRPAWT